ncbi:MAG: AraC family transcriptional regulator [Clostridia bacterium]|nr:AraC family transcriptional regulator [Clostridia bacterium]
MRKNLMMSVSKVSLFLANMDSYGITKEEVLRSASVDPILLQSPDNRCTSDEIDRIFKAAARLTQNENIGLLQGEKLAKSFSNILGYILINCGSLGEAAEKYNRYEKLVDETSISELSIKGNRASLRSTSVDQVLEGNRGLSDFKMAGMLLYTRILSGKRLILREAHFSHSKPQDLSEYQRVFNCPIFFEKPFNALVFDKELLKLPVIEPNRQLLVLFENIARELLDKIENNETYSRKVHTIILKEMKGEAPSVDMVAKTMAVSVRSLQGYLKREGTSYTKLINEARKDLALHYLKSKNASISEIAYVLGFSEISAFNRAFKKWTNRTPGEFRMNSVC